MDLLIMSNARLRDKSIFFTMYTFAVHYILGNLSCMGKGNAASTLKTIANWGPAYTVPDNLFSGQIFTRIRFARTRGSTLTGQVFDHLNLLPKAFGPVSCEIECLDTLFSFVCDVVLAFHMWSINYVWTKL